MARISHGPSLVATQSRYGAKRRRGSSGDNSSAGEQFSRPKGKKARRFPRAIEDPTEALVQQQLRQESRRSTEQVPITSALAEPISKPSVDRITQIIKNEFATEILLKYQEIRLIQQELAKVKICYEQLKRVSAIPFNPELPTPALLSGAYADGLKTTRASAACAVDPLATNGAYMQHYKAWLIQHPSFGTESNRSAGSAGPNSANISNPRITRAASDVQPHGNMHAAFRGVVMHRDSDNQDVVLICKFCGKRGFTRTTGIMNHCLIVHKHKLHNHQEAAEQLGHPVIRDEGGRIVGPLAVGVGSCDDSPTQSPLKTPAEPSYPSSPFTPQVLSQNLSAEGARVIPQLASCSRARDSTPFHTPNLAQRIRARHRGVNFEAVMTEMKQAVSMDEEQRASDCEIDDQLILKDATPRTHRERHPSRKAQGLDGGRDVSSDEDAPGPYGRRLTAVKGYHQRLGRSPAPLTFSQASIPATQALEIPSTSDVSSEEPTPRPFRPGRLRYANTSTKLPAAQIIPSSQPEADEASSADNDSDSESSSGACDDEPSLVSDDGEEIVSHDLSSEAEHEESAHKTTIMDNSDSVAVEDSQDETVVLHAPEKVRVRRRIAAEHRPNLRGDVSRTRNGTIIKHQERHVSMMEKRRTKSQSIHR